MSERNVGGACDALVLLEGAVVMLVEQQTKVLMEGTATELIVDEVDRELKEEEVAGVSGWERDMKYHYLIYSESYTAIYFPAFSSELVLQR